MNETEDRRAALNIKVSLAANLVTVALALIGAEGAIAVFVLDKREHLLWFYVSAIAAFIALALSVRDGGLGIAGVYRDGYKGQWTLHDAGHFNRQSVWCVTGAALLVVSSMLGSTKSEQQPHHLEVNISALKEFQQLKSRIEDLSRDQEELRAQLVDLKSPKKPARQPTDVNNKNTSTSH